MFTKRIFAAMLVAMMMLVLVASAHTALAQNRGSVTYATPEGYDEHDYQKLVAFLETADENGVKNGNKVSPVYDPSDPQTWLDPNSMDEEMYWIDYGEKMISLIRWESKNLVGELDVSGCTALQTFYCSNSSITAINVSGCVGLTDFACSGNLLSELDVSSCGALRYLMCGDNRLTSLDVSSNHSLELLSCGLNQIVDINISGNSGLQTFTCGENPLASLDVSALRNLEQLNCSDCGLSELDLSQNTKLRMLWCTGNRFTELDLSHNQQIQYNSIRAEGGGYIGTNASFSGMNIYTNAVAEPMPGASFIGWFNDEGELVSETEEYASWHGVTSVTARFTEVAALPGDIDGNGSITANDALMVLRSALGIIDDLGPAADVNGDGNITANDALIILRAALGIA